MYDVRVVTARRPAGVTVSVAIARSVRLVASERRALGDSRTWMTADRFGAIRFSTPRARRRVVALDAVAVSSCRLARQAVGPGQRTRSPTTPVRLTCSVPPRRIAGAAAGFAGAGAGGAGVTTGSGAVT